MTTHCSLYEKVPNFCIDTTKGYKIKGACIFIINCSIYYAPKGIARFPDGGVSKNALNKYYFYKYDYHEKRLTNIGEFVLEKNLKIISFKSSEIVVSKDNIFVYTYYYDNKTRKKNIFIYNIKNKTVRLSDKKHNAINFKHNNYVTITETSAFFKNMLFFKENGLPDPLSFLKTSKRDKNLFKIVLKNKGNRAFRLAIIGKWIKEKKFKIIKQLLEQYSDYNKSVTAYFRNEEKKLIESIIMTND